MFNWPDKIEGVMDMHEELFIQPPKIGGFNFDQELEKVLRSQYNIAVGQDKIDLWNKLYVFYQRSGENILCQEFILEDVDAYWMEPFQADLYFKLGQTKERMGEYSQAVDAYTRALGSSGQSAWLEYFINNNLGFCLLIARRFDEAEKHLRVAISINPDRHNAWKNLGVSLEHQGKIEEAFGCFCRAFEIERMDPRVPRHLLRLIVRSKLANVEELLDRNQVSPSRRSMLKHIAEYIANEERVRA